MTEKEEITLVQIIEARGDCERARVDCMHCPLLHRNIRIQRECFLIKNDFLEKSSVLFQDVYNKAIITFMESHSKEDLVEILL